MYIIIFQACLYLQTKSRKEFDINFFIWNDNMTFV